jgi:Tfp pilus assembly protein PilE
MFQPKDGRGLLNAAFDIVEEAQQASGTYKQMLKEGRRADAQAFLQENLDAIQAASLAGKFRQQMGEWAALKKTITASPRLTPEEKRDQIKRITDLQNRYAKVLIDSQR